MTLQLCTTASSVAGWANVTTSDAEDKLPPPDSAAGDKPPPLSRSATAGMDSPPPQNSKASYSSKLLFRSWLGSVDREWDSVSVHVQPRHWQDRACSELHDQFKPVVVARHSGDTLLEMPIVRVPFRVHVPMPRQVHKHGFATERRATIITQYLDDGIARGVELNGQMPNSGGAPNDEYDGPGKVGQARKIEHILGEVLHLVLPLAAPATDVIEATRR